MNNETKKLLNLLIVAAASAVLVIASGCDGADSNSQEIALAPSSITLTNDRIWVVTFRAGEPTADNNVVTASTNIFFPLTWNVSDPSLGKILSSEGASMIYQTEGGQRSGVNIVTVQDQSGSVGQAPVILTFPAPVEESATF